MEIKGLCDHPKDRGKYIPQRRSVDDADSAGTKENRKSEAQVHSFGENLDIGMGPASISHATIPSLNTGTEYWNGSSVIPGSQERLRPDCTNMELFNPSNYGDSGEIYFQDQREIKRQKRKEANRESARRSRQRKQAECDDLATKVQSLTAENKSLQLEVDRLSKLCRQLASENSSLLERLAGLQNGPEDHIRD